MSATAARSDAHSTLVRYFEATGDTERAQERASALLDAYAHGLAQTIRAAREADRYASDAADDNDPRSGSCECPPCQRGGGYATAADLIDPEVTE